MPYLYLSLSLFALSQSAIFIRFAHAHVLAIGFWRMVVAPLFLAIWLTWQNDWSVYRRVEKKTWLKLFACGFLLFAHFYTWFLAVQKTSVANSVILFCSNPLYTAIGAWLFFRERLEWRQGCALLFAFAGILVLFSDSKGLQGTSLEGDILGFICSVLFSAYVLMSKSIRKVLPNIPFAFATYCFCGFFFWIGMEIEHIPYFAYDGQTWLAFAGLTFGSTLLGHSLFTHSLQYFNVNLMSVSTLLQPILSALVAYLVLAEPVRKGTYLGFLLVSVGILILYYPHIKKMLRSP